MDVFEAAYRVAHDFRPDGAVGLARRLVEANFQHEKAWRAMA